MHAVTDNTTFIAKPCQVWTKPFACDARSYLNGLAVFGWDFQVAVQPTPHASLPDMTAMHGSNRPCESTLATRNLDGFFEGSCIHEPIIQVLLYLSTSDLV